jgi:CheY-like chemotaxis protein
VLLVEDEAALRELARRALEAHGLRVTTAGDGQEALERAEASSCAFDILVTDSVMPRLAGPRLVQRLRSRYPNLRVVMMSGYPDPAAGAERLDDLCDVYLNKPFRQNELVAAVDAALAGTSPT